MTQNKARILVVDDEASMREVLQIMLERDGYQTDCAENGAVALQYLHENDYDLLISDIKMPRMGGIELLRQLRAEELELTVLMMTAFSSTEDAVEAMKLGAYDYITKPFKTDEIRLVIRNAFERKVLRQENLCLKKQLDQRFGFKQLIGNSASMRKLIAMLERIAPSQANVLIEGESGTGKELVARALHFNSLRKSKPFIAINCGAIPENLLESELFGHERGSFTGAERKKEGLLEAGNGGTVFLDEIGELPMSMQVKLLRVLQEREFRRVGGTKTLALDIRLLAATNRNLAENVAAGLFREDLYYRLNVVSVEVPPLRARCEDIPLLINFFYHQFTGHDTYPVQKAALDLLLNYKWPGNVRELENLVERCVVLGGVDELTTEFLPEQFQRKVSAAYPFAGELSENFQLDLWLADMEKRILLEALDKAGGVRTRAAELLGISFRSMRYRLAKLGINDEDDRP